MKQHFSSAFLSAKGSSIAKGFRIKASRRKAKQSYSSNSLDRLEEELTKIQQKK